MARTIAERRRDAHYSPRGLHSVSSLSRALLVTVSTIIIVLGVTASVGGGATKFVLQDGSTVEFVKAEYGGTSHRMTFGTTVGKTLCSVQSRLPNNGPAWLGRVAFNAGGSENFICTPSNALVIWLIHRSNPSTNLTPFRVLPVDADGSVWGQIGMGSYCPFDFTTNRQAKAQGIALSFEAFPRRGKLLRLRLYSAQVKPIPDWHIVDDFQIANPAYGHYAEWAEPTRPARVIYNGVEITLEKLQNGPHTPHSGGLVREGELGYVDAQFGFRTNGVPTDLWGVESFELEDAAGNVWHAGMGGKRSIRQTRVRLRGRVPTNETVRVRARLENYDNPNGHKTRTTFGGQVEFITRVAPPD